MRWVAWVGVALLASCGSSPSSPVTSRVVDLEGGWVAKLGSDGQLSITFGGATWVATKPGVPLLSRILDPSSPDSWHDAKKLDPTELVRIDDRAITIEKAAPGVLHIKTTADDAPTVLVSLALAADDQAFYTGLGERFDHVSARGQAVAMQLEIDASFESATNDRHVPIPFLVASRSSGGGFGVLESTRESGVFDVAKTDPTLVRASFEGKTADIYLYVASDPLDVVGAFSRQTGLPRKLPRWALGPMVWRNEWTSDAQLLGDAAELRTRHIPTTTMWIDNPWEVSYNDFTLDPKRFVDAPGMMQKLKDLGYRVIGWSTPYLEHPSGAPADPAQTMFLDADSKKYFVRFRDGSTFLAPGFDAKVGFGMIDFTDADASAYWSGLVGKAVSSGFSGFKLDYGEDILPNLLGARLDVLFADGTTDRNARAYPLGYDRAYHAALDKQTDGVLVVRASGLGGAAFTDVIWPGDLDAEFEHYGDPLAKGTKAVGGMPDSAVAAQTLAVSGFPSFGADIGGFRNFPTKESLLRWAEQSALGIIMQLGGGGDSHDPWTFDEETSTIYAGLARLHMQLEPYLANVMTDAETKGLPTMRPLPLVSPGDSDAANFADDEYELGPDLLAAPVSAPGVTSRKVHFPAGSWVDFWNGGAPFAAGSTADVAAPLGKPPLFVRAGAVIPMSAPGLDTLEPSIDMSTISAATSTEVDALCVVQPGKHAASWDDGATLSVDDGATGVALAFAAGKRASTIVVTLDVRAHTKAGALTKVTQNGVALASYTDETALRAAASSGFTIIGDRVIVRISGSLAVLVE